MNVIYRNKITEKENNILPFLEIEIKDEPLTSMESNIRKSKNIISDETYKLVDEYKILKSAKNFKNSELSNISSLKRDSVPKKIQNLKLNNNNSISATNLYFKTKVKLLKAPNKSSQKYKKIKNMKLLGGKNRYLSLLKKYESNKIKNQINILEDSKTINKNIFLSKPNISITNAIINESQINNDNSISKTLRPKKIITLSKDINNSFSKFSTIEKTLQDTHKNSMNIIKRINRFKERVKKDNQNITDILYQKLRLKKNIEEIKNENSNIVSEINNYKLLGPLNKEKNIPLKKIKINKKSNNQIWMKQSTANLIKFGHYFNMMDDEQFFKQRKKIIKKFAAIEKDSDIIDGINTERNNYDYGNNIKKNNKIITTLAENNFDFFKSVSKKLDNI